MGNYWLKLMAFRNKPAWVADAKGPQIEAMRQWLEI